LYDKIVNFVEILTYHVQAPAKKGFSSFMCCGSGAEDVYDQRIDNKRRMCDFNDLSLL
jgi:hypothetical protein